VISKAVNKIEQLEKGLEKEEENMVFEQDSWQLISQTIS
jgi:hypothetical protein